MHLRYAQSETQSESCDGWECGNEQWMHEMDDTLHNTFNMVIIYILSNQS